MRSLIALVWFAFIIMNLRFDPRPGSNRTGTANERSSVISLLSGFFPSCELRRATLVTMPHREPWKRGVVSVRSVLFTHGVWVNGWDVFPLPCHSFFVFLCTGCLVLVLVFVYPLCVVCFVFNQRLRGR
ncbi:hypothetical protein B0T17DRAFT_47097 [Bombardia bombarda]|uniref:Secreted protein n=1 Tax=Bombardia bombarda TaxID=252184 RepID=A0AA39XK72_9PEZI|nr:hypothetical protein B0T17DRAFT_47097 [Bombardia bombarda]